MVTYNELLDAAVEKVELAGIYVEDGAPRTAASRLREAADLLDQAGVMREAAFAESAAS